VLLLLVRTDQQQYVPVITIMTRFPGRRGRRVCLPL
jgi:hypothetical protein